MFNFISMAGNYADRAVARYEKGGVIIDTVYVTDGDKSYETGICHPEYNNGDWVIVEAYDSKDEAKTGHDKWVSIMTSDNLPSSLSDCCNSGVSMFLETTEFPRVIDL